MFRGLFILLTALAVWGSWHKGAHGSNHPRHNIEYVYYELDSEEDSGESALREEHEAKFRMDNAEVDKYLDEERYKHEQFKFFEFNSEEMAFSDEDGDGSFSIEDNYKIVRMSSGEDSHSFYGYLYDEHYGGRHH